MKRAAILVVAGALGGAVSPAGGEELRITNMWVSSGAVGLAWTQVTNRYITAQRSSLATGTFQLVGNVVSLGTASLSRASPSAFYRIRSVDVVQIPDAGFESVVREAIVHKYLPANEVYDIDVCDIGELRADNRAIADVTGLRWFSALTNLVCFRNQIGHLDVSANGELRSLSCQFNRLESLDMTGSPWLRVLNCASNLLTELDASGKAHLASIDCSYNPVLTNLSLSGASRLSFLDCSGTGLSALELPALPSLGELWCFDSGLDELDVSGAPALTNLYCSGNALSVLDVRANGGLMELDCYDNRLTFLDLSANTNLVYVDCTSNPIEQIVVWDTNQVPLPADFFYDGDPLIRPP